MIRECREDLLDDVMYSFINRPEEIQVLSRDYKQTESESNTNDSAYTRQ